MMNSREILEFITDNEKVTLSKLSQLMGIKRAQPLYDIRDGKIKAISANYADKILSVFPEYSRVWLITGEGQPFSKNENEENIGESIIMAASERFLEVMEGLKIGPYVLEKDCGVKNAQAKISHYKKGVTKAISADIIVQLCEAYPQVNANYILTGKGPMFLDNETSHSSLTEKDVEDLPSPETAEYWKRMYETTVVMYEAQFEDLQRRFNVLNKSVEEIQDLFSERRKAV
ncbi:hypothetical protein [Bacteroides stercoris]|nr:hypothetical protein [Bacteroides stercoris]DAP87670.1 MAG TPA: structural protein [Caudoviricetes sp.]